MTPEEEFPHVLGEFRRALADLIEPRSITSVTGVSLDVAPLVEQIGLVTTKTHMAPTSGATYGSRPPLWVGGLDWTASVYKAISRPVWDFQDTDTEDLGELLASAMWGSWAPPATSALAAATPALVAARWAGLRLLHPQQFTVSAPCPECGERYAHTGDRVNGIVRVDTISVNDLFAECAACSAVWWGIDIVEMLAVDVYAQSVEDDEDMEADDEAA